MKITKTQIKQIIKEELDEGIMDTLKSAGSAVKKAFMGPKLPPLGYLHVGTKKTRELDKIVMEEYKKLLAGSGGYRGFKFFVHIFLGLPDNKFYQQMAARRTGFDPENPDTSKETENLYYKEVDNLRKLAAKSRSKYGSSGLFQILRSLASGKGDRTMELGQMADYVGNWPGGVNPLEKKNYVISPDTARSILNNDFFTYVQDLDQSDIDGYIPPGYGDEPAEEEDEQDSAAQMKESKMKITKTQLKQIIKEEIEAALAEAADPQSFVGTLDQLPDSVIGGDVPGADEEKDDQKRKLCKKAGVRDEDQMKDCLRVGLERWKMSYKGQYRSDRPMGKHAYDALDRQYGRISVNQMGENKQR